MCVSRHVSGALSSAAGCVLAVPPYCGQLVVCVLKRVFGGCRCWCGLFLFMQQCCGPVEDKGPVL